MRLTCILGDHQQTLTHACDSAGFGRIVIPGPLKPEFLSRLSLMNVTPASLFPGVDGICHSLRDLLRVRTAAPPQAPERP